MTSKTIAASLWKVSLLLVTLIALDSCTPKVVSNSSSTYKEDLTKYLPDLAEYKPTDPKGTSDDQGTSEAASYPEPTNHLRQEIDQVVEMTVDYNKSRNVVEGYSIQVYSGTEIREVEEAEAKLRQLSVKFRTRFKSPIYRTKVGKFYSKIEANKELRSLKKSFPLSVLVIERFRIED